MSWTERNSEVIADAVARHADPVRLSDAVAAFTDGTDPNAIVRLIIEAILEAERADMDAHWPGGGGYEPDGATIDLVLDKLHVATGGHTHAGGEVTSAVAEADHAADADDADTVDGQHASAFAAASHGHAQADVTNLTTDLAAKAAKSLWTSKGSILAATAASTPSAITPAFPANEGHVLVARTAESSGWAFESAPSPANGVTAASTLTDLYLIKGDGGGRGVQTGPALTATGGTAGDSGKVVTLDAVGGIPSASMIQAYKIDNPIDLVPTSPDAMDDEFAGDGSLDGKWLTLTGSGSAITIARSSSLCRIVAPVGATLQGRYQTGIPSPTGDWAFELALKQWRLASYVQYSCPIGLYVWENSGSNRNYGIYLQDMGPSGPYVIHLQVGYYINWAWSYNPYADYYHSGCRESAYAPLYLRISRVSGNLVFAYSNTGDASAWRTVYTVACPWTPDANTAIGIVVPWAGTEAFNMIKWFRKTG